MVKEIVASEAYQNLLDGKSPFGEQVGGSTGGQGFGVGDVPPLLPTGASTWTKDRVKTYYDLAHSDQRPEWMDDNALGLIDAAYSFHQTTSGAELPVEVSSLLDTLPDYKPETKIEPPGGYTQGVPLQPENIGTYGLTDEQWQSLSPTERLAMRVMKTNARAGMAIGGVSGLLQGGAPGLVGGIALGGGLGKIADKFPWLGKVFDAFDVGARTVKRTAGMGQLGIAALTGKDGMTVDMLMDNLDKAWYAAEQFHRVNFTEQGTFGERLKEQGLWALGGAPGMAIKTALDVFGPDQEAQVWGGPSNPLERHTLSPEEQGTAAMVDLFQALVDGKPREQAEAEVREKFGFQGDMTDMVGMILLDPLNVAGGVAAKGLAKGGKLLGWSDEFVKGFSTGGGLVKGAKQFRALAGMFQDVDDVQAMGAIERWVSGQKLVNTPEGVKLEPRLLSKGPQTRIGKALGYLPGLTKESRAKELLSVLSHHMPGIWDAAKKDPHGAYKLLERISENNLLTATELGMRSIGSGEMTALIPAIRENLPNLKKLLDNFDSQPMVEARGLLKRISDASGDDLGTVLKNLIDPDKGGIHAKKYFSQITAQGADTIGDLTPEKLSQVGAVLYKQPLSDKGMLAKMGEQFINDTGKWSAEYFGLERVKGLERLSNLTKSISSMFLLDLSPVYLTQNVMDNALKLIREGGILSLTEANPESYLDDFFGGAEFVPARFAEGFLSDTAQIEHMGEIAKAVRPKGGPLEPIEHFVSGVRRKYGIASRISGSMEGKQRVRGNVTFLKMAMNQLNRPGVGIPKLPDRLAQRFGPEVSQWVYSKIMGETNIDRIAAKLFSDNPGMEAPDAVPMVAQYLDIPESSVRDTLDKLGIMDYLKDNLPADATSEQVHLKLVDLLNTHKKGLNDWYRGQINAAIEKGRLTGEAEGVIGMFPAWDKSVEIPVMQRLRDFMEWEQVMGMKGLISDEAFGQRVQFQFSYLADQWKRVNGQNKATILGTLESMDVDSSVRDFFADSLTSESDIWDAFYKEKAAAYKKFFDKSNRGKYADEGAYSAAWQELRQRFDEKYRASYTKALAKQLKRDEALVKLMGDKYGEPVGKAVEVWRTRVRETNTKLHELMDDHMMKMAAGSSADHMKMWTEFKTKTYNKMMRQMMADNYSDALEAFRLADDAERAGTAPNKFEPLNVEPEPEAITTARELLIQEKTGFTPEEQRHIEKLRLLSIAHGLDRELGFLSGKIKNSHNYIVQWANSYLGSNYEKITEIPPEMFEKAATRWEKDLSPEGKFVRTKVGEMPPYVAERVKILADRFLGELRAGEAGKKHQSPTGEWMGWKSTNAPWYRSLFHNQKINREAVEKAIADIIAGNENTESKAVIAMKKLILEQAYGDYDPMYEIEIPGDPAILLWLREPVKAAEELQKYIDLSPNADYDKLAEFVGGPDNLDLLVLIQYELYSGNPIEDIFKLIEEPNAGSIDDLAGEITGSRREQALNAWYEEMGKGLKKPEKKTRAKRGKFKKTDWQKQEQVPDQPVQRAEGIDWQGRPIKPDRKLVGGNLTDEEIMILEKTHWFYKEDMSPETFDVLSSNGLFSNAPYDEASARPRWFTRTPKADLLRKQLNWLREFKDKQASRVEVEPGAVPEASQIDNLSVDEVNAILEEADPIVEPELVGNAPVNTIEGLADTPHYEMLEEGMADYVLPILREMEKQLSDPNNRHPKGLKGLNLSPDEMKEFTRWFETDLSGAFRDTKLAAARYAELGTDMAMLNYQRRYGFDNVLNVVFPYQFWYTRSALNWMLSVLDRPAWYANWMRIREMQEKYAEPMEGFPDRLTGKLRFQVPFLPKEFGDTIFYDPWHQAFGFEGMLDQIARPLNRDFSNQVSRAQYIAYEMYENEEISESEYRESMKQTGDVWEKALNQAKSEVDAEIASPMDLVNAMSSYSLPIQWALSRKSVKEAMSGVKIGDTDMGQLFGLKESRGGIGSYPSFATIQSLTSFITPGGINVPEFAAKAIGAAKTNDRGFLWEYYIKRELTNMAIMGADPEAVKLALVEGKGPLWDQALDTVGKQQAVRQFTSFLWADFFPEGEAQQRSLKTEFEKAAVAGELGQWLDKHPAYEARLLLNKWDNPDGMMKAFTKSSIWETWNNMPALEQKQAKQQLDEVSNGLFSTAFLNKETRNYDTINTETMVQWARMLNGVLPENAPATAQAAPIEFAKPEIVDSYEGYVQWRDAHPGYALTNILYSLPEGMQAQFRLQHPEVVDYQQDKYIFMAQHPDLVPYLLGEENDLRNADPETQLEVIQYRAAKAIEFPRIDLVNDTYWTLGKAEQRVFLDQHPELKEYWDWSKEAVDYLSPGAFWYVKGDQGIEKLRKGKAYEAAYQVDYSKFSPDLTVILARSAMVGTGLGSGAKGALKTIWEREGRPYDSFDKWVQYVLQNFVIDNG